MPNAPLLTIGTRGSPLALAQAEETARRLGATHAIGQVAISLSIITTTGDATQDRALSEIGGKGLFTKEIDTAQLEGRIDLAVHSAKDLPTELPEGLVIAGYLAREDVRDALIAPRYRTIEALPHGARIGTVSLRRQAMLKRIRPDLRVETLRGNVQTRLAKAHAGEFDAILLAMAGLNRLGLSNEATEILAADRFVPAVGQGAIALVIRRDDEKTRALIAPIIDADTGIALATERAFLTVLDGSCRTPIGGHAELGAELVYFRGIVLAPDGTSQRAVFASAGVDEAAELGEAMGRVLKSGATTPADA